MVCTGSVAAVVGVPDVPTAYAAEGTAAHEVSEWARIEEKPVKAFIGRELEVDGFKFKVDAKWASAIQRFVDYCDNLECDEALFEERVHYTAWVENGWGTADDIRIAEKKRTAYVTDLKFGQGVKKFAKGNPQLMLYALGVYQDFGHLYDFKKFVLTIHQPRLDHVDVHEIKVKDLLNWAKHEVRPKGVIATTGEGAEFVAGDHCQFCPIKKTCDTRDKYMQDDYLADFDEELDELPAFRVAEILAKKSQVIKWYNDIEEHALSLLQKGDPAIKEHFKLVAGRGGRVWKDPEAAEAALRKISKIKVRDLYPAKFLSPPAAEKLIGADHPVMKEQVKKTQGKPVMVPADDTRPEYQVTAENEFDNLDEAEA
jgi:hypothetical protein